MLESLSTTAESPETYLEAAHAKTRRQLVDAERLLELGSADADEIVRLSAALRRYFTDNIRLHEADELVSVLPRLVADEAIGEHFAMILNEHAVLDHMVAEIAPLWALVEHDPSDFEELHEPLARATRRLVAVFELHLTREEDHIFPRLRALETAERAQVLVEMKERRAILGR